MEKYSEGTEYSKERNNMEIRQWGKCSDVNDPWVPRGSTRDAVPDPFQLVMI